MYSRDEVKALTDKVLNMAKADAVEVDFTGGERSATRWANSNVTANMVQYDQSSDGHRLQRREAGIVHDARVRRRFAEGDGRGRAEAAQTARDNPDLLPLVKGRRTTSRSTRRCRAA